MEVHHVRRLKDLKGKEPWEIQIDCPPTQDDGLMSRLPS